MLHRPRRRSHGNRMVLPLLLAVSTSLLLRSATVALTLTSFPTTNRPSSLSSSWAAGPSGLEEISSNAIIRGNVVLSRKNAGTGRLPTALRSSSGGGRAFAAAGTTPTINNNNNRPDESYFSPPSGSGTTDSFRTPTFRTPPGGGGAQTQQKVTLTRFLSNIVQEKPEYPELRELESLLLSLQMACKTISNLVSHSRTSGMMMNDPPMMQQPAADDVISGSTTATGGGGSRQFNSMVKLDELSTIVLRNALRFTGKCRMVKPADDIEKRSRMTGGGMGRGSGSSSSVHKDGDAEHQPGVLIASALDSKYVAFFDPLDGSNNADAAICTGTIFGVFGPKPGSSPEAEGDEEGNEDVREALRDGGPSLIKSVLQPGKNLRAAGYCLYSSATILVFTMGKGTHMFTLDPQINEFVLTQSNIRIPERGNIYSCNESNSDGWDDGTKRYIAALKSGNNQSQTKYTSRYVGSMVGDIHRTLMYGGVFCYPRDEPHHPDGNLQLLYKTAPMAYIVSQAGGKSSTGTGELLDVMPKRVHERQPCFIGSPEDVDEMKTYMVD